MYLPRSFAVEDVSDIRDFVAARGAADFVTVDPDGQPLATLMPCIWIPDDAGLGVLLMHMSRANRQWESITKGDRGLAIVHGLQAYVSPRFYPSKVDTGKVVPTWNYTAVHFTGTVTVSHEAADLLHIVEQLTDKHESTAAEPWQVSDAPVDFVESQLRAIVAVTLHIDSVQAKAKLNQNRTAADREGARAGLAASTSPEDREVARLMGDSGNPPLGPR